MAVEIAQPSVGSSSSSSTGGVQQTAALFVAAVKAPSLYHYGSSFC